MNKLRVLLLQYYDIIKMEEKAPEEKKQEQQSSLLEKIRLKKKQRMIQLVSLVVLLVLFAAVVTYLMFLHDIKTSTSTSSSTTSTTSTTTSLPASSTTTSTTTPSSTYATSTTAPTAKSGDVRIVGYQFKSPYTPEKNYLEEEWIILKNFDDHTINLTNWVVRNSVRKRFTIPEYYLKPGASVKIHTGRGINTEADIYLGFTEEFWNNEIDSITVYDSSWQQVDYWKGLARAQHPEYEK